MMDQYTSTVFLTLLHHDCFLIVDILIILIDLWIHYNTFSGGIPNEVCSLNISSVYACESVCTLSEGGCCTTSLPGC